MAILEVNKLKELGFTKQLAFAYLTCERLYPNYVYFSKNYRFGNPSELRKAIDYLYSNLFDKNFDKAKIDSLIAKIDTLTPQPANYDTVIASSALDACGVIYEALNFLVDKKPLRLESISTMATDTADMYIQEKEDLDFNTDKSFQQKIDHHPLMIKEISIQKGIINYLSNVTNLEASDIDTLIQLQENNKGSLRLQ
jgi:uncharacterized protein YjaG (DUF416 family)